MTERRSACSACSARPGRAAAARAHAPLAALLAVLALAALLAVLALAALLLAGPLAGPARAADSAPDAVTAWLRDHAPAALAADTDAPSSVSTDYKVGSAQPEYTWTDAFLAGEVAPTPVTATDRWLAPVSVGGEVLGGVVVQEEDDGTVTLVHAVWEEAFGKALMGAVELVWDESVRSWFALDDGQLWAVTEDARGYLAGTVELDSIQLYVQQWNGTAEQTAAPSGEDTLPDSFPVALTAVIMAALLAVTGLVVFARRAEERHERS